MCNNIFNILQSFKHYNHRLLNPIRALGVCNNQALITIDNDPFGLDPIGAYNRLFNRALS